MIRPLRQRHRIMTVLLGVIVIPLFVLALLNREPVLPHDVDDSLSGELSLSDYPETAGSLVFTDWGGGVHAEIRGGEGKPLLVHISVSEPLKVPNPLLYWIPGESFDDAVLIGPFPTVKERMLELPRRVRPGTGSFVVYSLGHQEESARAKFVAAEVTP